MRKPRLDFTATGTWPQRAHEQGQLLGTRVKDAWSALTRLDAFRARRAPWLPHRAFVWLARRQAATDMPRVGELGAAVAALAQGAGMRLDAIQLLNIMEATLGNLDGTVVEPGLGGCTAAAVGGTRSATGRPHLTRNLDHVPELGDFYVVKRVQPRTGHAFLALTAAPLVGSIDGVNAAGLAMTYNYAFSREGPGRGWPISACVESTLASCANVHEAIQFITAKPRMNAGLLMLVDASGAMVSLGLSSRQHHVKGASGADVLVHSNLFDSVAMRPLQVADEAVYGSSAPAELHGRRVLESPRRRQERMQGLLQDHRTPSAEDLLALFADHGSAGTGDPDTVCMHDGHWVTTATVQLLPFERQMRVAYGPRCSSEVVDFAL